MSLKKKIIFSFFISAFIIAVLAVFEYINYHQIRDEMRFLEVTDTVRSKSLQLRRHEKNYFLYAGEADEELKAIYDYIAQLEDVTASLSDKYQNVELHTLVRQYGERIDHIVTQKKLIDSEFEEFRPQLSPHEQFASLIAASFLDRPVYVANFLKETFSLPPGHQLVVNLLELDHDITALRKHGEDIIAGSKKLDTQARIKAERGLHVSQIAILIVFPLFLLIGLVALFSISSDVVRRLRTLTDAVEKTGEKYTLSVSEPESSSPHSDEVGELLEKFLRMEKQLDHWEEELKEKNRELLESKKLAAIGTLASGVAHELNNPLNNIFLSVQVLQRQMAGTATTEVSETLDDIAGQTSRVKGIVSDLLEFARERGPHLVALELNNLVTGAYNQVRKSVDTSNIHLSLDLPSHSVIFWADRSMFERVFINLFTNAVAAMEGGGELIVKAEEGEDTLRIWVSDNGKGMPEEVREKIFDPFFTRKEKGTGLGLAIVLNIVKKHHGTISVVSEEGEGTAFEITLPKGKEEI